jgi:hypothetical protein
MIAQLAQSPEPTSPPDRIQTFATAPGLTTTRHREALLQQATAEFEAESEVSRKRADLKWAEEQNVARADVARKEQLVKNKQAATQQKGLVKEIKARDKQASVEKKAMLKEHAQQHKAQARTEKKRVASKSSVREGDDGARPKKRVAKIYCICRGPAGRKPMIGCDRCPEWYHFECLGFRDTEEIQALERKSGYLCPTCEPRSTLLK